METAQSSPGRAVGLVLGEHCKFNKMSRVHGSKFKGQPLLHPISGFVEDDKASLVMLFLVPHQLKVEQYNVQL